MSLSKNNVVLIGVVKSISHESTKEDVSISKITIETFEENEWNGKKTTRHDDHSLIAFGRISERVKGLIAIGDNLYIEGKLRNRIISANNQELKSTEILCSKIENLTKSPTKGENDEKILPPSTSFNLPYRDVPF